MTTENSELRKQGAEGGKHKPRELADEAGKGTDRTDPCYLGRPGSHREGTDAPLFLSPVARARVLAFPTAPSPSTLGGQINDWNVIMVAFRGSGGRSPVSRGSMASARNSKLARLA